MQLLKQSTAATTIVGPILDSAGVEYASAVIGDLTLTKNGTSAAMASAATLTYIANGYYTLVFTTGNTDTAGRADVTCNKSTYQMPPVRFSVLVATVFDALITNATTAAGGLGDIQRLAGTALTGRDIGASVLLSTGTGTGQLDFTSGVVKANATQWLGGTIPAVNVTGVPLVDAKYLLGTIFSTPTVAGIPNVNAKTWNDLATVALPATPTNITAGTITTVTTVTNQLTAAQIATGVWQDTTAGDFTAANSIGKSVMNGVTLGTGLTINAYTGNTVQTGDSYAIVNSGTFGNSAIKGYVDDIGVAGAGLTALGDARIANLDATISSRTKPADTQAAVTLVTTTTTLTNLPAITAGWLTATGIAADAITAAKIADGAIDAATFAAGAINAAAIAADAITDAKVASDVTIASVTGAVGSVTGAVGSVTARVTANTDQLAGQTVTAAAGVTFPTFVASPTNLTAGTITTVTNQLTAAAIAAGVWKDAVAGDFTIANSIGKSLFNAFTADTSVLTVAALANAPTANQNADAFLDRASAIDGKTPRETLRIIGAMTAGKLSGAQTATEVFVGLDGSTTRVTVTADANGNRSAVVFG